MNLEEEVMRLSKAQAACEKEHQDFQRRLDNHAEALRELRNIFVTLEKQNSALERVGNSVDRVEKKVDGMDSRVKALEREPGDLWKKTTWEVLKYVLLALLGLLVGWIIKTPAP